MATCWRNPLQGCTILSELDKLSILSEIIIQGNEAPSIPGFATPGSLKAAPAPAIAPSQFTKEMFKYFRQIYMGTVQSKVQP